MSPHFCIVDFAGLGLIAPQRLGRSADIEAESV